MRRAILGAFFLLAACGGDVRSSGDAINRAPGAVDQRADRARYLLTSAAQEVIASFAKSYDQSALDTCLNAWVEEGDAAIPGAPVAKPQSVFLRVFLSQCLTGEVPGHLRSDSAQGLRSAYPADVRTATIDR